MKAAAATLGIPFVDLLTPAIFVGSGKVGATTGSGNADWARTNDGIHPTDAGHWMLAQYIAGGLSRALGIPGP
jgi:phospholipase/lecithinase/hemolysin